MDPTDDELNNIDSLVKAFDWAGVPEDVRTTLGRALGSPTMIRDVVFVARAAWDEVIAALKGLGPEDDDGNRPERELHESHRQSSTRNFQEGLLQEGWRPSGQPWYSSTCGSGTYGKSAGWHHYVPKLEEA